jgi:hypothetical protein
MPRTWFWPNWARNQNPNRRKQKWASCASIFRTLTFGPSDNSIAHLVLWRLAHRSLWHFTPMRWSIPNKQSSSCLYGFTPLFSLARYGPFNEGPWKNLTVGPFKNILSRKTHHSSSLAIVDPHFENSITIIYHYKIFDIYFLNCVPMNHFPI